MTGSFPRRRRRLVRFVFTLALFIILVWLKPARAQSDENLPQEPNWTSPGAAAPEDESAPTDSAETDFPSPENSTAVPSPDTSLPAAPASPPVHSVLQTTTPAAPPPESPAAGVGVPVAGNWNLPDLTDPMAPFFQMEGLRMRLGVVEFALNFGMSFAYNDNIFNAQTPRVADYITTITPTFTLEIGDAIKREDNFFAISYSPQPQIFAENSDQTTINENLAVALHYQFPRLTEDLAFSYAKNSNPTLTDIGRVETRQYSLLWTNSYALTARTALEFALQGATVAYTGPGYTNYSTVSATTRLAYEVSPKLLLTLGPSVGVTTNEGGQGKQTFESITLGFEYKSLSKLAFHGGLGFQVQQFDGANANGDQGFSTPTFSLGLTYQASEKRSFTLDLNRSVQNSGFANGQTYINTTTAVGVTQQLLRGWSVAFTLAYTSIQYQGGIDDRTDTYVTASPTLNYTFWREQCVWSLFYTRTQRFSDIEAYQFDANVLGTGLTIQF